jgi:hypothetical protein
VGASQMAGVRKALSSTRTDLTDTDSVRWAAGGRVADGGGAEGAGGGDAAQEDAQDDAGAVSTHRGVCVSMLAGAVPEYAGRSGECSRPSIVHLEVLNEVR